LEGAALGLPRGLIAGPTSSEVWDQATRCATFQHPVLVLGESGSGKENVARLVHCARGVARPFVGINAAALPSSLFEAELFGHERGAFTGASVARPGAFREAHDGVLFLDEIADMSLDAQVKLLRALDLKTVRPLGSSRDVPVNVQVVAATSQDLAGACAEGRFRSDLYYRLAGVVIRVPPLRERRDEVLLLAATMLADDARGLSLSCDAAEALTLGSWDGNVRELRSALVAASDRVVTRGRGQITREDLPPIARAITEGGELTEARIRQAMSGARGVASRAAEVLGVSRSTFYNACRRVGVDAGSLRRRPSDDSSPP
jgi:DNA-binding NtrC family response regulator